jgi:ATP-binding cassette subfamily A (ABC1) protein 3
MIAVTQALTAQMCDERAIGLVEFLLIAGVRRSMIRLSWLLFSSVFVETIILIVAIIFITVNTQLLARTDLSVFICLLLLYGFALIGQMMLIASVSATSQRASVVMFVVLLVGYVTPQWAQLTPTVGYTGVQLITAQLLCLLHCTVCVQVGVGYVFARETSIAGAGGVTWTTLAQSPVDGDGFNGVAECMIYLVLQIAVYQLLAVYFDHVAPSKYGARAPWYFPCVWPWLRRGTPSNDSSQRDGNKTADKQFIDIESPPDNCVVGIRIDMLTKAYGRTIAVNRLTTDFYKQQITVLLGHNGAGKSTTMNMLTGENGYG